MSWRPSERLRRIVRLLFGLAGSAFLVVAFVSTVDEATIRWGAVLPELGLALVLATGGLWLGAFGWSRLLGERLSWELAAGFLISQLGKYIPGGVWQAAGQIGYATRSVADVSQVTIAFVTFGLTQAAAGAGLGSLLLVLGVSGPVRLLAAGSLVLIPLMHRRWMSAVVRWWLRRRADSRAADDLLPQGGPILVAFVASVGTLLLTGAAFALIVAGLTGSRPELTAIPAFGLSWTIGFLALPVPAGLGVRESVLLGALSGSVSTAGVVAASVALRAVIMIAELVSAGVARLSTMGRTTTTPDPSSATSSREPDDRADVAPGGPEQGLPLQ